MGNDFIPDCPVRGVAMVLDGEPIAIGGYAVRDGFIEAFSQITDGAREYPRLIVEATYAVMAELSKESLPILADRDPKQLTSERYLRHFGFEPTGEFWRYP